MNIVQTTVSILAICAAVLAITGTMAVLIICCKELIEYISEFLRLQRVKAFVFSGGLSDRPPDLLRPDE